MVGSKKNPPLSGGFVFVQRDNTLWHANAVAGSPKGLRDLRVKEYERKFYHVIRMQI